MPSIGFPPSIRSAFTAHFAPEKLPREQRGGVSLRIDSRVRMEDGSHPPALEELLLDLDRNVAIDARGLPACRRGLLETDDTRGAEIDCGEALVGEGKIEFEVARPEQSPFPLPGRLLAFNGGVSAGKTRILIHAYLATPIPGPIVIPAEVSKAGKGVFGLEASAKFPQLAGGYGSVTNLSLKLGRKFTYKGKQQSYLQAKCPEGRLLVKATDTFSDGSRLSGTVDRPCTPAG